MALYFKDVDITRTSTTSGLDGLSAYELAVQKGFVGTLDEWLESLHGEDGQDGLDGEQGEQGVEGKKAKMSIGTVTTLEPDQQAQASVIAIPGSDNEYQLNLGIPKGQSGSGGGGSLHELSDVDDSQKADGKVLKYNSTTSKWEAGIGGGGGTTPETAVPMFYLLQDDVVYDVYMEDGVLKTRIHEGPIDKELVSIDAVKVRLYYEVGQELKDNDVTTTATYSDSTTAEVDDWTSNKDDVDMTTEGSKTLTITYTEGGITKTDDITILVAANSVFAQGFRDTTIIPDKYNTGLTTAVSELTPYSASSDTSGITWRDWSTFHGWDGNKNVFASCTSADIVFENVDFTTVNLNTINWSSSGGNAASNSMPFDEMTVTFKNCLILEAPLGGFVDTTNNHTLTVKYENCMTQKYNAGCSEANNCLIGNRTWFKDNGYTVSTSDISNVRNNATFNDCYFCDVMVRTDTQGTEHIDGWQASAAFNDITFNNCRFELPYMSYATHSGGINVVLFAEKTGSNFLVKDCVANGGGNYIFSAEADVTNGVFENVKYGQGQIGTGVWYSGSQAHLTSVDTTELSTAYVTSVFKDTDGVHVIMSNDLTTQRTINIKTDCKEALETYTLSANYKGQSMPEITNFEDLPVDVEYIVPNTANAEYVVVYDEETQIRFVDFTDDHRHTITITPDLVVMPDKYNAGAHGTLTEFDANTDTSGINWRDKEYAKLTMDFNNGSAFRYLTEAQKDVVFEDIDFVSNYMYLDILNRGSYKPESAYRKDFQITFTFRNCKLGIVNVRESNKDDPLAPTFKFENCTMLRVRGNALTLDKCIIGNHEEMFAEYDGLQEAWDAHSMNGDPVACGRDFTMNNSYVMDAEDNWYERGSSGTAHIDGIQFPTVGSIYDNVNMYNVRLEVPSMPWTYTQGGYNAAVFLQGTLTNSSLERMTLNGGGFYTLTGYNSETLDLDVAFGNNYGASRETYPYGGSSFPTTGPSECRTLERAWQEHPIVSSIFYDGDDTKVVYSNDTNVSKTLTIKTSDGDTYTQTVEAMPMGSALIDKDDTVKFSDYPIDRVYTITGKKPDWVQVYDEDTLIRTEVLS